jgi:hypothetical protein
MTTKIERTQSLPSTPKAQGVSRTQAPAAVDSGRPVMAQAPTFSEAEAKRELLPTGQHVTKSADPDALWGSGAPRRNRGPDVAEFKRLPPAERRAKFEAMRAERDQLKGEIQDRVGQLDRKWNYALLRKRTASLRDLQTKKPELSPDQAKRLDAALGAAEAAEKKVAVLAEKAKSFGPDSKTDPVQAAARKQLASELRKARAEQSEAVHAATAVIDEAGLKIDRLANAEQVLDKTAAPQGSGSSLWDKVTAFFDLGWVMKSFSWLVDTIEERANRESEQRVEDEKTDREFKRLMRKQLDHEEQAASHARTEQLRSLK